MQNQTSYGNRSNASTTAENALSQAYQKKRTQSHSTQNGMEYKTKQSGFGQSQTTANTNQDSNGQKANHYVTTRVKTDKESDILEVKGEESRCSSQYPLDNLQSDGSNNDKPIYPKLNLNDKFAEARNSCNQLAIQKN